MKKKALKELVTKGLNPAAFEIRRVTHIEDGIFIPHFGKDMRNLEPTIGMGFIKIATEFALSCGLPREALNRVLRIDEIGKGELFYHHSIINYFPQGAIDKLYEYYRPLFEPSYPTHTLILFTQPKRQGNYTLYCYVELFSTFQNYVILNHDYDQELYRAWYQPVLKDEILGDYKTTDLVATLRNLYLRFESIYDQDRPLDEIEQNIRRGVDELDGHTKAALEGEMEGIGNFIINQNMDRGDFTDMSQLDFTGLYKRYFYNHLTNQCQDMPAFCSKASVMADKSITDYVDRYYSEKISVLLQTIIILRELAAKDNLA